MTVSRLRSLLRTHSFLFALIIAVALFVANLIALPAFVSVGNWDTNLTTFAPFAILAVASTPAVLTGGGGLDLSIAPSANLSTIVLVLYLLPHSPWLHAWLAIPVMLAVTTAIGLFNGTLVAVFRYPPVVATVGMLLLLLGLNSRLVPYPVPALSPWIQGLSGDVGPVPWGLILIAIPPLLWSALKLTPFLRTLYLVGGNPTTAYSAGVNVAAVRIAAYGIGGLFAGIGALALAALVQTDDPNLGMQYSLIALAAVALGGTPIGAGGRGGLLGSMLGAAVIYLIQNLLIVAHVSNTWLQVVYGAMLIAGAVVGAKIAQPPRAPRARSRTKAVAA
jgi:ribose transport system permease protein